MKSARCCIFLFRRPTFGQVSVNFHKKHAKN
jgi:hypothetical protein